MTVCVLVYKLVLAGYALYVVIQSCIPNATQDWHDILRVCYEILYLPLLVKLARRGSSTRTLSQTTITQDNVLFNLLEAESIKPILAHFLYVMT